MAGFDASQLVRGLEQAKERQIAAARRAIDKFGEHVIGDAQQLTPVDTGALQASGTTTPAELDGTTITKVIGFNTSYAAAVHENLTANHSGGESKADFKARKGRNALRGLKTKKRNGVGQSKFLSTAMRENASKMVPFVQGELDKVKE